MKLIPKELWEQVISHKDTELYPGVAESKIKSFETSLGYPLPDSHREFLKFANGGVVGYIRLFGIGQRNLELETNLDNYPIDEPTSPVLPFASSWGGDYYCFDLENPDSKNNYPVLSWSHDNAEDSEDLSLLWTKFSKNYLEFLNIVTS